MASSASRRASYQLEAERRASVNGALIDHAAKLEREHAQQQQPSPQPPKPSKLVDTTDDSNNQEEGVSPRDHACASISKPRGDDWIRPASPVASTPKVDKKQLQLEQADVAHDPSLTTARLRQENAALKLQLVTQGNQHESEVQALKIQLTEAVSAHQEAEERLRKQINELEKRQYEAVDNALKYQAHLKSLQTMLHALENQTKGFFATPRTPLKPPQPLVATTQPPRRGNNSPLPYNGAKPFAWRQVDTPSQLVSPAPPCGQHVRHEVSRGESLTLGSPCANLQPTRCIPVPLARTDLTQHTGSLPPALSVAKGQQRHHAVLTKKPSGGLLSYCADVISSKLVTQSPVSTSKPNMKVMPVWSVDKDDDEHDQRISSPAEVSTQPMDVETLLATAEDYTAITIP